MAAVSQRLTQQLGPVEDVADFPAKRFIVHILVKISCEFLSSHLPD